MIAQAKFPGGKGGNESTCQITRRGAMRAHMPNYQEGGNESTVPGGGGAMIAHAKFPGGKGGNESTCQITRRGAMRAHMLNYQEGGGQWEHSTRRGGGQ